MEIITTIEPCVGEQFDTMIQAQYRGSSCSSSVPRIDDINFNFTKKNITRDWLLQEDSTELIKEEQHPVISNTCRLSREQLLNAASAQETIKNELKEWPVPADTLNKLIEKAVGDATLRVVQSVVLEHNILDMLVELTAEYDRTFVSDDKINSVIEMSMEENDTLESDDEIDSVLTEMSMEEIGSFESDDDEIDSVIEMSWEERDTFGSNDEIDAVIEMSMQDCEYGVVPTSESSIESLKRKMIDSETNESCSICLEELSSGCEAFCMPCSHMFHGDCIGEWLRISHYCPNCRHEMPTD